MRYFEEHPSPFVQCADDGRSCPIKKRVKLGRHFHVTDYEIVSASYAILKLSTDYFRRKWNWSSFIEIYINHEDVAIQW